MQSLLRDRIYANEKPDRYWRASRIAARLCLKQNWNRRDARLASQLAADPGIENRLIDQAISYLTAPGKIR